MTAPDSAVLDDMRATVQDARAEEERARAVMRNEHTPDNVAAWRKAMDAYALAVRTFDDELRMRLAMLGWQR